MLHTCIDLHQFGIIVNQIENFFPCEIIASIKVTVNLSHEFQVFGSVDCPAVVAEVGGVMEEGDIISAGGQCLFREFGFDVVSSTPS